MWLKQQNLHKMENAITLHVGLKSYDALRIADFADFDQIFQFL